MNTNTNFSLQLLLLNDLLQAKVIDQTTYDQAVQKITAFNTPKYQTSLLPLATA